ncbi:hypothetical protein FHR83_006698 [Actinoplanes campanulatus]|uniref:DUF2190 family protein n=1 Tax=Actinoplanes campanulatus TaxID=113559 RepID=A0A7W5AMW1_9ACTN|nr:capsid cement protein [Actinoplanes campanulatus]MBB3098992.1 hypothetical protein [Actinoplanes campanulatus]GGN39537.1 hypothetical protein GCM10010109_67580 [Actinoplanes campanulatus]GID40152.1 hypothetical protein Aca09nite_66580 [Actinoplanes campanulatus]
MADYAPLWMPGDVITVTTSAAVTGGKCLVVSGNGTVAMSSASSVKWVGVAACDIASGAVGPMHGRGQVHTSTAAGAITAGDQLVTAASGNVAALAAASTDTATDINSARSVIGIALTTAADTATVTWMEI